MIVIAALVVVTSLVAFADDGSQKKAIEKLELLGGKVTRDETSPRRPVIAVDFRKSKRLNDKYLHLLRTFTHLIRLDVGGITISREGLKELQELKSLSSLGLMCSWMPNLTFPKITINWLFPES